MAPPAALMHRVIHAVLQQAEQAIKAQLQAYLIRRIQEAPGGTAGPSVHRRRALASLLQQVRSSLIAS
jgi:hypothetical protein